MPNNAKRHRFFIATSVFLVPLCFFTLVELSLRLLPEKYFQSFSFYCLSVDNDLQMVDWLEADPVLFWRPQKNVGAAGLNELGWRNPSFAEKPPKETRRIITLGDSFTFGYNVNADEAYPMVLGDILNHRQSDCQYNVINLGVPGYSSYQGLTLLKTEGLSLNPKIVTACFGINDAKMIYYLNDVQIAAKIATLQKTKKLFHRFRVYTGLRYLLEKGILHTRPRVPRVSPEDLYNNLFQMYKLCQKKNIKFILIEPPMTNPTMARRVGGAIGVINLVAGDFRIPLLQIPELNLNCQEFRQEFSEYSSHPPPSGHRFVAERLADMLEP